MGIDSPIGFCRLHCVPVRSNACEPFLTEEEALDIHLRAQESHVGERYREAVAGFEVAAEYFAAADGPNSPDLANILTDWAISLLYLSRYEEAEEKSRRSKEILEGIRNLLDPQVRSEEFPGENHPQTAGFLTEYGILCRYCGRFEEAETYYLRALRIIEDWFGKESPEMASLYHNLGGLAHARGDFAGGEPYGRKAYELRRAALGEDHSDTLADGVAWGGLLDGLGRYEESAPIYRRALAHYERRFGMEHFEVAATLNNLGMARAAQGGVAEALMLLGRCLVIKRKLFGEGHPEVLLTEANLRAVCGRAPDRAA